MDKLAQQNRAKLIDVLTERLTFERAGVKLYDALVAKMQATPDAEVQGMINQMKEHRDQEKEHEEWLEEQIRSLGGDAHGMTDLAKLVETESEGIEKIMLGPDAEIPHLFHALFVAELADNAGWDLLVELADEAGDRDAKKEFKKRLHEEEEHLALCKRAVEGYLEHEVLGEPLELPTQP